MDKVVATLRADGSVFPAGGTSIAHLANLMNYKIRTEVDMGNKSLSTLNVPTTIVDLGKQLLQYARDGDLKGVKNMLSRGAPFTADWLGMSALHFAAMNNQFEICDALLKGGINKDAKTKVDRTPLHVACYYGHERIAALLLDKYCSVNPRDMLRMTPLHWAVEKRHKSIVRLLLKHDADVTPASKFGRTPIALAVMTEQADILQELEAARQAQANRKLSEETEKETSEAVNSIMGLSNFATQDNDGHKMELDTEDDLTNPVDLQKIKSETQQLNKTAINLLKSHGISMIADNDASTELITTTLKGSKQLVLSEGGKMLLNETKKIQINNNNSSSNNKNSNVPVPMSAKNDTLTTTATSSTPHINKLRPNIISKAKDNPGICKNKNIRIISLNDFKKLYGNSGLKSVQKLPASMANTRLARQLSEDARNSGERKTFTSVRQLPSRQPHKETTYEIISEEYGEPITNIIQLAPTDSEAEASDGDQQQKHPHPLNIPAPMRPIPAKRVEPQPMSGASGTMHLRTHNAELSTKALPNVSSSGAKTTVSAAAAPKHFQSSVIPLLTMPEICRQLMELRKQNDELRRKFETAQREKEDLRQRLDRLEELLLVEKADEDYAES